MLFYNELTISGFGLRLGGFSNRLVLSLLIFLAKDGLELGLQVGQRVGSCTRHES